MRWPLPPHDQPNLQPDTHCSAQEAVALRKGGQKFQARLAWGHAQVGDTDLYIACLIESFETVRRTKDGRAIDVSVTLSSMWDAFGAMVGISKIARDISDRKSAEFLRMERERSTYADAARTELMVSMNHEIRTPLSQIEGFANRLLESPLQADQGHSVQSIKAAARALQKDLNNILESVEITAGGAQINREAFDVQELVAEVRQILERLVSNAFKFTQQGRVSLVLTQTASSLEWAMSDTGCRWPHRRRPWRRLICRPWGHWKFWRWMTCP